MESRWKKVLITGASLLMVAGLGAGIPNVTNTSITASAHRRSHHPKKPIRRPHHPRRPKGRAGYEFQAGYRAGASMVKRYNQDGNIPFSDFNSLVKTNRIFNNKYCNGLMTGMMKKYNSQSGYPYPKYQKQIAAISYNTAIRNARTYRKTHNKKLRTYLMAYFDPMTKQEEKLNESGQNAMSTTPFSKFYTKLNKDDPLSTLEDYSVVGSGDVGGSEALVKEEDKMDAQSAKEERRFMNKCHRQFVRHYNYYMFK